MKLIGVTGGTGSGKSTLLKAAEALGGLCIDCDVLYRELLKTDTQMLSQIEARFPGTVQNGELNRKALGNLVFADKSALLDLNAITHKVVSRAVWKMLSNSTAPFAVIDAIGLFESDMAAHCDVTITVSAPEELRIERLMLRDGISREYAEKRIRAQKSDDEFRALSDLVLETHGKTTDEFIDYCKQFLEGVLKFMEEKDYAALRNELFFAPKNGYDVISDADYAAMEPYCKDYMQFISTCKTEREAVTWTIAEAEKRGFQPLKPGMKLKPGDKVYGNGHGKCAIFAIIGTESLNDGTHICAAHLDSPRMDLKPNPLYEDSELAFFRTHYYGGIKKYQWTTVPLALHGVVAKKDGTVITVTIGEDPEDPVFCVTDLLVHLAADQMKKTLAEGVTGENLRVLLGSKPLKGDEGADRIRFAMLCLLNDKYGITEDDFLSAELTIVPAGPARDVGLDRSMIAAYGHDDRVCAYAAFRPMLELETPKKTAVCVLVDKEETSSEGISSMRSQYFETFMDDLCKATDSEMRRCFENSFCLSADVTNAYDPLYGETCEKSNNTRINYGTGIFKYTGSRGKYSASDASAEVMAYIRKLFSDNGVIWQTGELGKVDQGGGGTVACYMADRNIETVDAGVPVLSMHSPMELVSKLDTYMTYKGMKVFYED